MSLETRGMETKMEVKDEILSFKDLMGLLNVSSNKLTRLTKQGLPYLCLGGETKIFLGSSVLQWLKSLEQPKPPEKKQETKKLAMG